MQYVKFAYVNAYPSCTEEEYVAFDPPMSDDELREWAIDGSENNAMSYEYLVYNEIEDCCPEEDRETLLEIYWGDCYGTYSIITEEEWEENDGYISLDYKDEEEDSIQYF